MYSSFEEEYYYRGHYWVKRNFQILIKIICISIFQQLQRQLNWLKSFDPLRSIWIQFNIVFSSHWKDRILKTRNVLKMDLIALNIFGILMCVLTRTRKKLLTRLSIVFKQKGNFERLCMWESEVTKKYIRKIFII